MIKLLNYCRGIVLTRPFQEAVYKIREKYNIEVIKDGDGVRRCEQCAYKATPRLRESMKRMMRSLLIYGVEWESIFYNYLVYDRIEEKWFKDKTFKYLLDDPRHDVCTISYLGWEDSLKKEVREDELTKEKINRYEEFRDEVDHYFPVRIYVQAYASINDVIDHLEKNKGYFREAQECHQNKSIPTIGKFRSRITWARDNYIYQKRHLPRKEITQSVKRKFGHKIDEIYVRNIIAREKKNRKEV